MWKRQTRKQTFFRKANDAIRNEIPDGKTPKLVKPFVTCYLNSRMKRLARIKNMPRDHPVRRITLAQHANNHTVPWGPPNRRVGRPRFKWVTGTNKNGWDNIKSTHPEIQRTFDHNDTQQHDVIHARLNTSVSDPIFLFK